LRMTSEGPVRVPVPATEPDVPPVKTLDFSKFNYTGSITTSTTVATATTTHPNGGRNVPQTPSLESSSAFSSIPHTKSKWSAADQETVMDVLRKNPGVSLKLLVFKLQATHGIEISEGVLRKVRAYGGF
jgi:hypothetical protein